jgi:hypothetical protein
MVSAQFKMPLNLPFATEMQVWFSVINTNNHFDEVQLLNMGVLFMAPSRLRPSTAV